MPKKVSNKTEKVTQAPDATKNTQEQSTTDSTGGNSSGITGEANNPDMENQVPVTLTKTVDGDTIKVTYNGKEETVRYLLIDTPEEKNQGHAFSHFQWMLPIVTTNY